MISGQVCLCFFFLIKHCIGFGLLCDLKQGFQFVGSFLQGSDERGIPDENDDEVTDQLNYETKGKCLYTSSAH